MWRSSAAVKRRHSVLEMAYEVGREIARRGAVLICGGLGGSHAGCRSGSLGRRWNYHRYYCPGADRRAANAFLTFSLATNLGHARNIVIAHSADGLIAVDGSYGTISEAAIALKLGKPVVGLSIEWHLELMRKASSRPMRQSIYFSKNLMSSTKAKLFPNEIN